jgi:hypothetical protein
VQPHLRSAFGDPESARDGRLCQVVDVPQGQQLTVLRGQTANSSAHIHLQGQQIKPIGSGSVAQIDLFVKARSGCRPVAVAKSFPSDDRAQPRFRVLGLDAGPQAPPHADQGLLGDVRGVVGIRDAAGLAEAPIAQIIPRNVRKVEKV